MAEIPENKKTLTPADYEGYIKKLIQSYEGRLSEQKDRIFVLVEENKGLQEQLAVFKGKDAQISKALMAAISKAKEIEDAARLKYDMEIERLKLFHLKWVSYYAEIKSKVPVNTDMLSAEAFLAEMDRILGLKSPAFNKTDDAEAVAQFMDESRRLDSDRKTSMDSAATVSEKDGSLDMNEVLCPKDLPDLDVLIKQMGILKK